MDKKQANALIDKENNKEEIDLISFDRRKRAAEIIQNEEIDRARRQQEQRARRNAERIRQAKIARIKGYFILGIMAIGILCIIIGVITGIVKIFSSVGADKDTDTIVNAVSEAETELIDRFNSHSSAIFTAKNNDFLDSADKMLTDISINGASAGIPALSENISDFGALSLRYMYLNDHAGYTAFRDAVKNVPMFSNGYIWSETDSMKSSVTGGYLYDTNASYILAVANICLMEGNTDFLTETDTDKQPSKDSSLGLTVSKKLENAINYLFDSNALDGGIKYDAQYTSLCYIHTMANNGSSKGTPSNRWINYKLGYLDAYCNIVFNKAMRALVDLYSMQGLTDDANKYNAVADQNAAAFSDKFWDSSKGRFVGCFDKDGNAYDYGFVFINLEAIAAGMATDEQASQIFSWLDGTRTIPGDTSTGTDIYTFGFAPRNTTLAADDKLWDTLGGTVILSGNGGFGMHYQNGGTSLSTAYYDITARYKSGHKDSASARMKALTKEFEATGFVPNDPGMIDVAGNPLSGLAPCTFFTTILGLETDGLHMTLNPDYSLIPSDSEEVTTLESLGGTFGIKNISFRKHTYNFLYSDGKLYITSDSYSAVRLKLGGFKPGEAYSLFKVQNGIFSKDNTALKADENGIVSLTAEFGADTYIKIEKSAK